MEHFQKKQAKIKNSIKKQGRGRPKKAPDEKKIAYNTRLRPHILKWLRKNPKPASQLIDSALINTFPEINNEDMKRGK